MELWTYAPDQVNITIGGFYSVEGLADGTFVRISKDTKPLETARTTDGMVARRRVINDTYTIEITVMSGSPANNIFTRFWKIDEVTDLGKFPILIRDNSGTGYFFSNCAWVEQIPSLQFSTSVGNNAWIIRAHDGVLNIGGNSAQSNVENLAELALSGLPYVQRVLDAVGG
jgi:hypothetical protein